MHSFPEVGVTVAFSTSDFELLACVQAIADVTLIHPELYRPVIGKAMRSTLVAPCELVILL